MQNYDEISSLNLFIVIFNFQSIQFNLKNYENTPRILYAIQTSGSTGESKTVHVPESAIIPNIIDFMYVFLKIENY